MRFQVPQFIETESKIIGPFTFKQFIYIAAGAVLVFIFRYIFTSLYLWIIVSLPIALAAFALAFYRIDGIPLPSYLMRALSFFTGPKKYIFNTEDETANIDQLINSQKNPNDHG